MAYKWRIFVIVLVGVILLSVTTLQMNNWGIKYSYAASSASSSTALLSVYVAPGDSSIYALNPKTGVTRWHYQTSGYQNNTPTIHYGSLYIGGENNQFYALQTSGGTLKWQTTIKGITIGKATVTSNVYVFTATGYGTQTEVDYLYALNANNGHVLWYYQLPGTPDLSISPLDVGTTLYIEANGFMLALNASNGTVLWKKSGYITQPSIYNNTLYAVSSVSSGTNYSTICALKTSDGSQLWCQAINNANFYYSPLIANGVLYAGSLYRGTFYAISTANGAELWQFQVSSSDSNPTMFFRPSVVNNIVYFQDNISVYAVNATNGSQVWRYVAPQGAIDGTPAVSSTTGMVYVNGHSYSSFYNYTAALHISNGSLVWNVNWPDAQIIAPLGNPTVA